MKQMLSGATVLASIASFIAPAFAASLPLVTTQPDPQADVRRISSLTLTLAGPTRTGRLTTSRCSGRR